MDEHPIFIKKKKKREEEGEGERLDALTQQQSPRRMLAGLDSMVKSRDSFANQLLKKSIKKREEIDMLY